MYTEKYAYVYSKIYSTLVIKNAYVYSKIYCTLVTKKHSSCSKLVINNPIQAFARSYTAINPIQAFACSYTALYIRMKMHLLHTLHTS